jgi:dihydroorotate dehydrogenase (NAD+) catalytic subunit
VSVDLTTTLAGLTLANPVLTASGCGGTGRDLAPYLDLSELGGFTTRTITRDARPGAPLPRVLPTSGGVLARTGLQNPGLQGFLASELPWLAQQGVRTVVSVAGTTLEEYGELARRVGESPGVHAVEVNLAGTHHDRETGGFDTDPYQAGKVVHVVRRDVPAGVPVLAKLSPGAPMLDVARAAARNGADALVVAHGFPGIAFDPRTLTPALGGRTGAVGGPAVLPQALRCVWDVHAALPDLPVVGVGGVSSGFDVLSMLLAGATAVQVGTALLADPSAPRRIAEELADELARRGVATAADLVGHGHRLPEGNLS